MPPPGPPHAPGSVLQATVQFRLREVHFASNSTPTDAQERQRLQSALEQAASGHSVNLWRTFLHEVDLGGGVSEWTVTMVVGADLVAQIEGTFANTVSADRTRARVSGERCVWLLSAMAGRAGAHAA